MNYRRNTTGKGNAQSTMWVSRTLETPQPAVETFQNTVSRVLGSHMSRILTASSVHLTYAYVPGVSKALRQAGIIDKESMRHFSYDLSCHLEASRGRTTDIQVNMRQPLVLLGKHGHKLALKVVPDARICREREQIDEFLEDRLGSTPPISEFEPHLELGTVRPGAISYEELSNPLLLMKRPEASRREPLVVPETITLNGLHVYVDGRTLRPH